MKKRYPYGIFFIGALVFAINMQKGTLISPFINVNTLEGVSIIISEDTVSSTGADISFQNHTLREDLFYGTTYYVEKQVNGCWFEMPALQDATFGGPSIDIRIFPDCQIKRTDLYEVPYVDERILSLPWLYMPPNKMRYFWETTYGVLPKGVYRIIIEVESYEDTEKYYLAATFSIN